MSAIAWVERRASELATEIEDRVKITHKPEQIVWDKLFMLAVLDYLDACGIMPIK